MTNRLPFDLVRRTEFDVADESDFEEGSHQAGGKKLPAAAGEVR
jgi:hypothetical protein